MKKLFILLFIVISTSCLQEPLIIVKSYSITQTDQFILSNSYIVKYHISLTYKGVKTKKIYKKTLRNVTEYNGDTLNLNFTDYYNIYKNSKVLRSHDRFGTHFIDSVYLDTVLINTIFSN